MPFAEEVLELGVTPEWQLSYSFNNKILQNTAGVESRFVRQTEYRVAMQAAGFILGQAQWDNFRNFFASREGRFEGFRIRNPLEYRCTALEKQIDTNVTTQGVLARAIPGNDLVYQVMKKYNWGVRTGWKTITKLVAGTIEIFEDGVFVPSGFTVDLASGQVTFDVAPTGVLTVDVEFDTPMRFDVDSLEATETTPGYFTVQNLNMIEYPLDRVKAFGVNDFGSITNVFDIGVIPEITESDLFLTKISSTEAVVEQSESYSVAKKRWSFGQTVLYKNEAEYMLTVFASSRGKLGSFMYDSTSVRFDSDQISFNMIRADYNGPDDGGSPSVAAAWEFPGIDLIESLELDENTDISSQIQPPELFNTGTTGQCGWELSFLPDPFPSDWRPNDSSSSWLTNNAATNTIVYPDGLTWSLSYTFFSGVPLTIDGQLLVDNRIDDILINGNSTGITIPGGNFFDYQPFQIDTPAGTNIITFVITNNASIGAGNPTGLRVEWLSAIKGLADFSNFQFSCYCIRIRTETGKVLGFTSLDVPLNINGLTYTAETAFDPTAISLKSNLSPDNLEIKSFIDSNLISEEDVRGGAYDNAEILIAIVDFVNLPANINDAVVIANGRVGEISSTDTYLQFELRSLSSVLGQGVSNKMSPLCRWTFCDSDCGLDIADFTTTSTVTAVDVDDRTFTVLPNPNPPENFNSAFGGYVTFTSGGNEGFSYDIETVGGAGAITLKDSPAYPVVIGDMVDVIQGCNKSAFVCQSYGNYDNNGGYPAGGNWMRGVHNLQSGSRG